MAGGDEPCLPFTFPWFHAVAAAGAGAGVTQGLARAAGALTNADASEHQALVSDNMVTVEGRIMWRATREEFGLGEELQTTDNVFYN